MTEPLRISVAWLTRAVQDIVPLRVPQGTTVGEAIEQSRLAETYGLDLSRLSVAVAGKRKRMDTPVNEGERIDILRPLPADPKEARRRRAARQQRPSGRGTRASTR